MTLPLLFDFMALMALAQGAFAGLFLLLVLVVLARSFLFICDPSEVLIFSGRRRLLSDGTAVGYRVIYGGRRWRTPFFERVDRMDLRILPIEIQTRNAYSKGGIPLEVHAIANVKVSDSPQIVSNAIERFLGRDIEEIRRVSKETLEGHLRGVLATLTPEEVNEDRLKFSKALMTEAGDDFAKLGLQLDTLKVQSVSDEVNYLSSIGREQIARVIKTAEVAESRAKSLAEQAEAQAKQQGEVATQNAEATVLQKQNELRKVKAELDAQARAVEETTEQAALQARAEAEQELQGIRRQVEEARLMADVILPAQADQAAEAFRARGAAADIEESGNAMATVLGLMTEAWKKAGEDARDIFLIQNLEPVLQTVIDRVNSVEIGEVNLLDDGDGTTLARYTAGFPAMVQLVLQELAETTGVDVLEILAPRGEVKS
jgi:flotillin